MNFDPALREVTGPGGVVRLTSTEGRVLAIFLRQPGKAVSRDAVMSALYDARAKDPPSDRSMDVMIWRVRVKLKRAGVIERIETVHSSGWVLRTPTPAGQRPAR